MKTRRPQPHTLWTLLLIGATAWLAWVAADSLFPRATPAPTAATVISENVTFTNARAQAREFIGYYESIDLTRAQAAIKKQALESFTAACCKDYSAYTCCCKCNLSRTVWGLAAHLIADRGYNASQVAHTTQQWLRFVNPAGFSGDACYNGGCGRPFAHNGCGGMTASHISF